MNIRAILAKSLNADCPQCGAGPLEPCWPDWHLQRVFRARRYGWVSGEELAAVLEALVAFQVDTAFRYVPLGLAS